MSPLTCGSPYQVTRMHEFLPHTEQKFLGVEPHASEKALIIFARVSKAAVSSYIWLASLGTGH
jgi:hypothetical protein